MTAMVDTAVSSDPRVDPRAMIIRLAPASRHDCRRIAELFQISSDGVADYIWSQLAAPEQSLLQVGQKRYERVDTAFSYQNCVVAERGGEIVGMMHSFVIPEPDEGAADEPGDPVLQPYAELELPGSLYIAGLAVLPAYRGLGYGSQMLAAARQRARELRVGEISLLCFAENAGAVRLYEREGFAMVARRAVVPHPLIHHTGDVLLMSATV